MIIKNGKVFQEDGSYKVTDLYVENGRIVASADEVTDKTELDASGQMCIRDSMCTTTLNNVLEDGMDVEEALQDAQDYLDFECE